ncbi:MAG: HAD-IC family P-type ATPase, partial [Bacillota bacterium]
MQWHRKSVNEVMEDLNTSISGLPSGAAQERLKEYGPNELQEKEKRPLIFMFLDQFRDFMILVLIAAAVISGALGEITDTIVIIVIVVLNAVIGFVQKYRAEKAMEALKKMAAPTALALRDGAPARIPAGELVPGDVVILEAGNVVPADLRLTETAQLKIDEAALTGESVPVEKHTAALDEDHLSVGDRKNMAFK